MCSVSTSSTTLGVQAAPRRREQRVERDPLERIRRQRPERLFGPAVRATERLALCSCALITCAASWNVLHSSRRASRRSRSSKRISSSSRSTSSRPGSSRRALSSTSVAAMSRNSVATSRSTRSMFSTSTQNTSTMRTSEISQRSTSSFRMRCKRRSNGPSNTGVETSYGTASGYPRRITALWYSASTCRYVPKPWREIRRGRAATPVTCPPMTRVFSGIQPTGDMHLGNYLGRRPPLGRRPAPGRVRLLPATTTRSSAWSTCTR